jgi:hypothetical protein
MTGLRAYLWASLAVAISLLASERAHALPLPLDAAVLAPGNQCGTIARYGSASKEAHWDLDLVVPEVIASIGAPTLYGYYSGVHFLRLWWFGPLVPVTTGTTTLQVSGAYAGLAADPLLPYPPLACLLASGDYLFLPKPYLLSLFRPPRRSVSSLYL